MTRLALVRHGATPWNEERRLQGTRDLPLSVRGVEEVRALAPVVRELGDLDRVEVVCSPLRRCVQTATELGVAGRSDPRWMEADLGSWTGLTRRELLSRGDGGYQAWRAGERVPPGAETLVDLRLRVRAALDDVLALGAPTTLVITHGGPIRAVLHLLLGLDSSRLVPVSPASLTVLDLATGRPRLAAYNRAAAPPAVAAAAGSPLAAETTD